MVFSNVLPSPATDKIIHLSMVCSRMGRGGAGKPTGIRLSEVHVSREFDILNVPRV